MLSSLATSSSYLILMACWALREWLTNYRTQNASFKMRMFHADARNPTDRHLDHVCGYFRAPGNWPTAGLSCVPSHEQSCRKNLRHSPQWAVMKRVGKPVGWLVITVKPRRRFVNIHYRSEGRIQSHKMAAASAAPLCYACALKLFLQEKMTQALPAEGLGWDLFENWGLRRLKMVLRFCVIETFSCDFFDVNLFGEGVCSD